MDITCAPSNQMNFEWLPMLTTSLRPMTDVTEKTELVPPERRQNKSKLCTPDGSFTFHLYTVADEPLVLTGDSSAA